MIYLQVDNLSVWIKKYDLEVIEYRCPKCEKGFESTIPFLIKGYAGLETPIHECGPQYREIIVVPRSNATESFLNSIL